MANYIALIHRETGSDYGVSFPDLPGCITAGSDLDEARAMAEEALAFHLEGMAEDDVAIPEPSSLEAVMSNRENQDGVAILVRAPSRSRRTVRVNCTFNESDLEAIDAAAEDRGMTRSGFLAFAARSVVKSIKEARLAA